MSSAICLNQKLKDAEYDIAPQMKKMKLNNSNINAPESDIIMSNLNTSDPLENLKIAFPSISENAIKEILDKSDHNIEGAKKLISEFKQNQWLNNPNNLNFHQSNRKRRYETAFLTNNINNTDSLNNQNSISSPGSSNNNSNGIFNANNTNRVNAANHSVLSNPFGSNNTNNPAFPERRIIKFNNKIYPFNNANISFSNLVGANGGNSNITNNNINYNNNDNLSFNSSTNLNSTLNINNSLKGNINVNSNKTDVVDDQTLENLLSEVGQYKTKEEIKAYLKNKITNLIKESTSTLKSNLNQTFQQTNKLTLNQENLNSNSSEKVDLDKISKLEKKLNSLESNNMQLKQIICQIYKKYESIKNSEETMRNDNNKYKEIEKENQKLKMEKENLEIALLQEKTDHNILKEFIRQFDESKGNSFHDTRHIY